MNVLNLTNLGVPGHVTAILEAKNNEKVDRFEPVHLGKYRYWWKKVCGFLTHYQPPFFCRRLFTPAWVLFFSFFLIFQGDLRLNR